MNGTCKLLSIAAGVFVAGSLSLVSLQSVSAQPARGKSEWLSIGIPDYLRDDKGAPSSGASDDDSLFSTHYEIGRFSVRGGRINPNFGLAWDKATGFYGTNMTDEPGSSDFLSLSTGLRFDLPGWGSHSLSGRRLLLDGSSPRNSFGIHDRAPTDRPPDGADMGDLSSSFNLVLEGGRFPILPDLTYHLSLINPSNSGEAAAKETGIAAGLMTRFDLGLGLSISPMVEAARVNDPIGTKDRERQYWSTSMLTEWRNWNLGVTYTQRETEEAAASAAIREYRAEASVGYVFDFGLSADVGWYHLKEQDESTDQFGFRFTYPLRIGQ